MKSTGASVLASLICISISKLAHGGYIPDLGLPSEALDFTPSDYKAEDYDFSQLANNLRRGDYESPGGSDHDDKLPAPTSYQLYNLESKNPVPVTIKIKKPEKPEKPEWPQPPIWLQQDSGSDDDLPKMIHPIPAQHHGGSSGGSSGGYGGHDEDSGPPALSRHPPSGPPSGHSSGGPPSGHSSGGPPPPHDFPPQDFSPPDKPWQGYNFEESD